MMDIVISNLVFWTVYVYLGTIPFRVMQQAIDNS